MHRESQRKRSRPTWTGFKRWARRLGRAPKAYSTRANRWRFNRHSQANRGHLCHCPTGARRGKPRDHGSGRGHCSPTRERKEPNPHGSGRTGRAGRCSRAAYNPLSHKAGRWNTCEKPSPTSSIHFCATLCTNGGECVLDRGNHGRFLGAFVCKRVKQPQGPPLLSASVRLLRFEFTICARS